MAKMKVFVSSTCYDLKIIRSQLREFILSFGFEPIMSDHSDILFDPRNHTHISCLNEVEHCDMLIVIIGSRFGGEAIPAAHELINIEALKEKSQGKKFFEECKDMSITQLEVLRAIELKIPIFTFIDREVWHDHNVYEKNKKKDIINEIEFPSIQNNETAKFIFEFINYLRLRTENNGVEIFGKLEDIHFNLRKQWSGLFQRLLNEQKQQRQDEIRIDAISSQIDALKSALLTSIQNPELKTAAQGAIKYKRLLDFLVYISNGNMGVILTDISFDELFHLIGIESVTAYELEIGIKAFGDRTIIKMKDGRKFGTRISLMRLMDDMQEDWVSFRHESASTRKAITEAIISSSEIRIGWIRLIRDEVPPTSSPEQLTVTITE